MKTNEEMQSLIKEQIKDAGSLRKWAKTHGIAPSVVSKSNRANSPYPLVAGAAGYYKDERWLAVEEDKP